MLTRSPVRTPAAAMFLVAALGLVPATASAARLGLLGADSSASGQYTSITVTNLAPPQLVSVLFASTTGQVVGCEVRWLATGQTRVFRSASGPSHAVEGTTDWVGPVWVIGADSDDLHVSGTMHLDAAAGVDPIDVRLEWTSVPGAVSCPGWIFADDFGSGTTGAWD